MKLQILLIFILSLFYSCNEHEQVNDKAQDQPLIELVTADKLTINPTRDTVITGKKGIRVFLEKNSFVDLEGNEVTGEIEIQMKEVLDLEGMIRENISTITKDGILETRGMVKIEAYANNKELRLAENKNLKITFPKPKKEEKEMKLFYGKETENGNIEWEIAEDNEKSLVEYTTIIKKEISIKYRLVNDLDNKNAYFKNKAEGKKILDSLILFTDQEKKNLLNKSIRIYWILFDDGDLEVYKITGDISAKKKREIEQTLNNIPFVKPFIREGDVADMDGVIDIWFRESNVSIEKDFYMLVSSQLGWINCDIFIEFNAPKIDMYVDASKDSKVKLVFKNYDAIISSYWKNEKHFFSNIPKDEPISIIVAEYQDETKMAKYSLTETKVMENLPHLSPYELLSLDELNDKFSELK